MSSLETRLRILDLHHSFDPESSKISDLMLGVASLRARVAFLKYPAIGSRLCFFQFLDCKTPHHTCDALQRFNKALLLIHQRESAESDAENGKKWTSGAARCHSKGKRHLC